MREPDNHNDDPDDDPDEGPDLEADEALVEVPIGDELDLHTFAPSEVKEVVLAYLDAAVERDLGEVRIVHGKGQGTLRRIVHAALRAHPDVEDFRLGDETSGSWGATRVRLRRRRPPSG